MPVGYCALRGLEKLRTQVDAAEAEELARIRKKLGLSQRKAAELTGGGVNAFSRYENGKAKPVPAVINLFRLLDKHPELIEEIAG
jgi:HTH-type transcriptional regulator/antitoxin MqsA